MENTSSKSSLSLFDFFKGVLALLKCKKALLIISVLLAVLSGFSFGSVFMLQTYDEISTLLRTQNENGQEYCFLQYKHNYRSHDGSKIIDSQVTDFDENELNRVKNYTNRDLVKCYSLTSLCTPYNFEFTKMINFTNTLGDHSCVSTYLSKTTSAMELNQKDGEEMAQIHRCEKLLPSTECRLPTSYDEIAISSLMAYSMLSYGLVEERLSHDDSVVSVYRPKTIDELIGRKTYNGLKISGIYSSNDGMCEYFEPYIKGFPEKTSEKDVKIIRRYAQGYSPANLVYVKEGFAEANNISKVSFYYAKLTGNYSNDLNFVKSFHNANYELNVYNKYNGFFQLVGAFNSGCEAYAWIISSLLVLVSLFVACFYAFSNVEKAKNDLNFIEIERCNDKHIFALSLIQMTFITIIEWLLSLGLIGIISAILNSIIGIRVFTLNAATVFLLFGIIVALTLIFSSVSTLQSIASSKKDQIN